MTYSPLGVTFGYRSDLLLESSADHHKYHLKLNRKLKQLRGRLNLISKDTKTYKGTEKLVKIDNENYNKNRLYGFLMLLMAERDLVFAESIKLEARDRGRFKPKEIKLLRSRIKRALEHCSKLLELVKDEDKNSIVAELYIYEKLVRVEYELYGRNQVNYSDAVAVSQNLSIAFAAIDLLVKRDVLRDEVSEAIKNRYNYILKEKSNAFTSNEQKKYIYNVLNENQKDKLIQLLGADELMVEEFDEDGSHEQSRQINWRSYSAVVEDIRVFEVLSDLQEVHANNDTLTMLEEKIIKWNKAIDIQRDHMESNNDEDESNENNQILLTYLQYNSLVTSVERDSFLFNQLSAQWSKILDKSMATRVAKYKEIEHIVKGMTTRLDQVMDLPGVYSDMDLTNEINLLKVFYETSFISGFLAPLFQSKNKFVEALSLYLDSQRKLENATNNISSWETLSVSKLLSKGTIETLKNSISTSWKGVLALAEYEKSLQVTTPEKRYQKSLVETLESEIEPIVTTLDNLFPLRPRVRPVPAKPSVFDMAYNYFSLYLPESGASVNLSPETESSTKFMEDSAESEKVAKKKGIFGFFGK